LSDRGHGVTALARSPRPGQVPDGADTVAADITEGDLTGPVAGHDAVVNLVALPAHTETNQSHEAVHVQGTQRLLRASEDADIDRFVQMSALGVGRGIETAYFEAKRRAEDAVRDSSLPWVIYRPSLVFGDGCGFFEFLDTWLPPVVVPFPDTGTTVQPLWVDDLTPMVADGVAEQRHVGNTYEIGGPEQLTMHSLVQQVYPDRTVLSVPAAVAEVGLSVADQFEEIPVGQDQFRVLKHDNTVEHNDIVAFRLDESDLKTLSAYLTERD
jgi:NADH dehydrogenase